MSRNSSNTTILLNRKASKVKAIFLTFILLIVLMIIAITKGNYDIPVKDVFGVILSKIGIGNIGENNNLVIVWEVRLPRIILAALSGIGLAMSGTVFQGVFRNPLVEPYILGVSSAAACGAAVAIVYLSGIVPISLMSFIFSVTAMISAYAIASKNKNTPLINLILSGVIVSSIFGAGLNLIKTIAPDSKLREISFWLMGGFYTAKWQEVAILFPCVVVSLIILRSLAWKLNVLTMGDQDASSLGIKVGILKLVLLGIATFITSLIVSQVGIISWVGLMIPHASRMIIGSDHRYSIPFSAFLGGCFLILCDTIARTVIMGEIPISIITSIIGAPYLIYLIRTNRQVDM